VGQPTLRARALKRSTAPGMPIGGDRRALVIPGWLTDVYFLVVLAIDLWSGSIAIISDAFHSFSAVGGMLVAWVAQRLSERSALPALAFG
jgi:cobalt-zinc-cadmium efflux system protein